MKLNTLLTVCGSILLIVGIIIFSTAFGHPTDAFKFTSNETDSSVYKTRQVYEPKPKEYEFKDINGDGILDIEDLDELVKYIKKLDAMDINDDGDIDIEDAELLKNHMFPKE